MSRIHDALLRVQQEREQAASKGDPGAVMQVLQNATDNATLPVEAPREEMPREAPVAVSSDLTPEVLMSRCRECNWSASGIAGSQDGGFGLEEMRTLRTRLYQLS